MSTCQRFEQEGLLLLEQGAPLSEHFSECADCQAAIRQYERLKLSLRELRTDKMPAAGWQDRVLDEIGQKDRDIDSIDDEVSPDVVAVGRQSLTRQWPAIAAMAASVAVIAIYYGTRMVQPPPLGLDLTIGDSGIVYRGESAKPGDPLTITATGLTSAYAEIRLYRNGNRLVLGCSDQPPCTKHGNVIEATVSLDAIGRYRAVALSSDRPLSASTSNLDRDIATASESGTQLQMSEILLVK